MSDPSAGDRAVHWFLRKEVSIGVILALVIQATSAVWYASKLDSRVSDIERSIPEIVKTLRENRDWQVAQRVRVWDRVEKVEAEGRENQSSMKAVFVHIENINRNLERLIREVEKSREKSVQ